MKIPRPLLLPLGFLFVSGILRAEEPPAPPTEHYEKIMKSIQSKDFSAAMEAIVPLRKTFPSNPEILLFEIAALEGSKEFVRCATLAQEFIEKHPESINLDQAHFFLGSALFQMGEKEQGEESLRKAAEITDDPSLRQRIDSTIGAGSRAGVSIGIRLGGAPPVSPEERKEYAEASMRILRRALRDFREIHSDHPDALDRLLEGDPPILSRLPLNPLSADSRFDYRKTETGYDLSESTGE